MVEEMELHEPEGIDASALAVDALLSLKTSAPEYMSAP